MIYVKNFGKEVTKVAKIKLSRYVHKIIHESLKKIPENNYFLGLIYENGDHQVFGSGCLKREETFTEALDRELQEELNLKIKNVENVQTIAYKKISSYIINISDAVISLQPMTNPKEDVKNKKVVFCVYGTELNILEYLDNVENVNNEDSITGIWAANVKHFTEYLNRITNDGKGYPEAEPFYEARCH